jgi:hypothetical protein
MYFTNRVPNNTALRVRWAVILGEYVSPDEFD